MSPEEMVEHYGPMPETEWAQWVLDERARANEHGEVIKRHWARIQELEAEVEMFKRAMPELDLDLDHLQALCDAATPGPWYVELDQELTPIRIGPIQATGIEEGWLQSALDPATREGEEQMVRDLNLLSAAREAVPALITRVRELEARLNDALGDDCCSVPRFYTALTEQPYTVCVNCGLRRSA